MYLVIKMQTKSRNKIHRRKKAPKKVPNFLLDVKMLRERFDLHLQMLQTKKQGTALVVSV